jgi:hypothetical protein
MAEVVVDWRRRPNGGGWRTSMGRRPNDFGCGGKNGQNLVPFIGPDGRRGGGPRVRMKTSDGG